MDASPSIAELRRSVQRRTNNVYDTLFTRRASVYVTWLLQRLGTTPNQVSVLAAAVGLSCCALIGLGTGGVVLWGSLLIHLYTVLDSVDGELARYNKSFSLKGLYLEDLSAYLMMNGMNLAVGGYLYRTTGSPYPLVLAVFIAAFARNAMPVARRALLKSIATRRPTPPDLKPPLRDSARSKGLRGLFRFVVLDNVMHSVTVQVQLAVAVTLEQALGLAGSGLALSWFALLCVGQLAKELLIHITFLRGEALEQELLRVYDDAAQAPQAQDEVEGSKLAVF